ncbi:MAG: ATP-binding protein [Clostridia bacterium]
MNYTEETVEKAKLILKNRKREAEVIADQNYNNFISVCPEAKEIELALRRTGSQAVLAVLKGGDAKTQIKKIKSVNLDLQKKQAELLEKHGFKTSDLEPIYTCSKCKDTGFNDGYRCSCFKDLLKKICYDEFNHNTPLDVSDFDHFSLNYYSNDGHNDRAMMERIFNYCKNYAKNFSLKSPNLLFQGSSGLGKTHLSLSIAKEAINAGYGVVYGPVHSFVLTFEKERFEKDANTAQVLSNCDLLILDDLGTENSSPYTQATLYDVINIRILKNLPTIITTNLTGEQIDKRYSTRLTSRFIAHYSRLGFVGQDIRRIKKVGY